MIRDNETQLATTVAFDLQATRPGPGEPLLMVAIGVDASLVITMSDTEGGTYTACTTVLAPAETFEFHLPSNTKRWIKATFATGDLMVSLPGTQTAV